MERFVQSLVAGGLALCTGLWLLAVPEPPLALTGLGAGLVVVGLAGLAWGIATELDH